MLQNSSDPRLLLIEKITEKEKTAALQACDLLCMPSRAEGLGVAYLEAWHFQKPVIALDLPVLREVIRHRQNGLLVKHTGDVGISANAVADANAVAGAITELLETPKLRQFLGSNGQAQLSPHYQWPMISNKMACVYNQALNTCPVPRQYSDLAQRA